MVPGTHAEHAAIWQKCCRPAQLHTECMTRRGHQCNPPSTPGNPRNRASGRRAEHVSERRPLHVAPIWLRPLRSIMLRAHHLPALDSTAVTTLRPPPPSPSQSRPQRFDTRRLAATNRPPELQVRADPGRSRSSPGAKLPVPQHHRRYQRVQGSTIRRARQQPAQERQPNFRR